MSQSTKDVLEGLDFKEGEKEQRTLRTYAWLLRPIPCLRYFFSRGFLCSFIPSFIESFVPLKYVY